MCYHKYLVLALWHLWMPNMLSPTSNSDNSVLAVMYVCMKLSVVSRSRRLSDHTGLLIGAGSSCEIGKKLYVYVLSEKELCTCAGTSTHSWKINNPTLRATAAGSVHALHFDMGVHTLLVMLQGRKAVTLIPPEHTDYLYPYPIGHVFARRAQVDLDHPDYIKYPLSRLVRPKKFVMHSGDMLFFSAGTPHSTVSLTDVISLTFRMVQ